MFKVCSINLYNREKVLVPYPHEDPQSPSLLQHPFSQKQGTDVRRRLTEVPLLNPPFYRHVQKSDLLEVSLL